MSTITQLISWMSGHFTNEKQANEDPENFFPIVLHMIPIWEEDIDSKWLYVEQAVREKMKEPYRQQVYEVRQTAVNQFSIQLYALPEPEAFQGAWINTREKFQALDRAMLIPLTECVMELQWTDGSFSGGLEQCANTNLPHVAYLNHKVYLTAEDFLSWEKGFNEAGEQVWGSDKRFYHFKRATITLDVESPALFGHESGETFIEVDENGAMVFDIEVSKKLLMAIMGDSDLKQKVVSRLAQGDNLNEETVNQVLQGALQAFWELSNSHNN